MITRRTFVNVATGEAGAKISGITAAKERPRNVATRGIHMTVMRANCALIDICACNTAARVTQDTRTRKRTDCVGAKRSVSAIVEAERAFANVVTGLQIRCQQVSSITCTCERADVIDAAASRQIASVDVQRALVHIRTRHATARVARVACTAE
jgi:hypothetical protein